ncbi:MAG: phenylacetate--CoA ligase [Phycisphaerales bacterium]|nr:phenylacetate--CoA ligase [Phycisphaerales bacterium]
MSPFRIENRLWDPPAETMPREQLQALQVTRLRACIARVAKVPFYREAFERLGIVWDSINTLDDLRRLPLTTKQDLREHYPLGFLAVPREQVVRFHGSSGTTGKPTFVAYTAEDMKLWSNMCARFLIAGGLQTHHVVQIAFGYGLFTGGFGLHQGVEKVGAAIVPAAAGNTARQLLLLQDMAPDVLICTPSYALNLAEAVHREGLDPHRLALKFGHFGGEPWTEAMRERIEQDLAIIAFNNYGLSEIIGPGVSGECACQQGMHLQEDHFLVECLDPATLEPVPEGQPGELVITTLTRQAMPVIRYRTRDISTLDYSPCPCGRTTARMSRVIGRTDDMFIVRGVNVYPSQIEEALLRVEGTAPHYLIEISRPGALDEVTVKVELLPGQFSDRMRVMQAFRDKIDREIHSITGIRVNVALVEPQTLERFLGKAVRVIDHRRLQE